MCAQSHRVFPSVIGYGASGNLITTLPVAKALEDEACVLQAGFFLVELEVGNLAAI